MFNLFLSSYKSLSLPKAFWNELQGKGRKYFKSFLKILLRISSTAVCSMPFIFKGTIEFVRLNSLGNNNFHKVSLAYHFSHSKGQIMSECIYEIMTATINFRQARPLHCATTRHSFQKLRVRLAVNKPAS